jgi:hypothetical protein
MKTVVFCVVTPCISDREDPLFLTNRLFLSSGSKRKPSKQPVEADSMLGFDSEDGEDIFVRNVVLSPK